MRYCVVGAGAVGGALAAYLLKAGGCVDVLARGETLAAIRENGITLQRGDKTEHIPCGHVCTAEAYAQTPDVVFVAVKGYSLESVVPVLQRVCRSSTVVIPLLNLYGTGETLQAALPTPLVTDGCVYIAAHAPAPGVVALQGEIFRVVFGTRTPSQAQPVLTRVATDLKAAGITPHYTAHVRRDTLKKYAYTSPMACAGLYLDADAGVFQQPGAARDLFCALMREIAAIGVAMGVPFDVDIVQTNLDILDALSPQASTSMQRDIRAGRPSEIDGLLFAPVRMGKQLGVPTPQYAKIAAHFGFTI